ncbi:amino acid transporter AVT6A-like isoform X2 [Carica papaya]|uniref:amino acid transporter AVT6A-like isoform X2 n=1 Tax=Carica papaya TaxID=3649 RepID=UPI000B8CDC0F|nr:amino acid transporter AVT6A-like isoform X2 [Carica papaya]
MTNGDITPKRENQSKRRKHLVGENAPLLPTTLEGNEFDGASFTGSVFNLSTTVVGAGIMALPATVKVLGLLLGIFMIIFMAFFTYASVELLVRFSRAAKAVSYGGVMGDGFGKPGRILLQLCILLNNFGGLIAYVIIIGDVLSGTSSGGIHHAGVLEGWFGQHWWTGRTFVLLVTTLGIFTPLAFVKRIGIAVLKLINGSIMMPRLLPNVTDFESFWKLFTVVPMLVTAYICHYNVHSVDNELEDKAEIKAVLQTTLALCSSIYVVTGLFCFLLFGDSTFDDVLANFDTDLGIPYSSLLNDIIRVSYGLHLMLVFPLCFYPLRLNLDGLLFPSARPLALSNMRFVLITIGPTILIFLGANFIPSIWDAFQFTGSTSAVCLGFIFPASITLRDQHNIATKKDKILGIIMIILAVLSSLVAIYSDVCVQFKKSKYTIW